MIEVQLYITEIEALSASPADADEKVQQLKKVLERLCREITQEESLQFSNLFSRLVFISQKLQLPRQLEWQLQHFRVRVKELRREPDKKSAIQLYRSAKKAVETLLEIAGSCSSPADGAFAPVNSGGEGFRMSLSHSSTLRVQLLHCDPERGEMLCSCEDPPGTEILVRYTHLLSDETEEDHCNLFRVGSQLNLIDCKTDKEGIFTPRLIVLEPDYLVDASALAECFQEYAVTPFHYFRNKFSEKENRSYLLLGNLANFFLDELVFATDPEQLTFDEIFLRSFKQSPFEYTSCADIQSNADFREFMQKAKSQFDNIRRVVRDDLPRMEIDLHHCTLEPSFYSERYGFQGRLDLLHMLPGSGEAKIVELKSGRLPYPPGDDGKIALNHEVQTAIYRMMIEGVFGLDSHSLKAAILYSAGNRQGTNLRFAAVWQDLESQITVMRNRIVAHEQALMRGDNQSVEALFNGLFATADGTEKVPAFYRSRVNEMRDLLARCSDLEKAYFYRFIRFVTRELYLQKIGDVVYETPTGLASLWNSDFSERAAALDVLCDLTINEIDDAGSDMTILFTRNSEYQEITNFREGDICIVDPRSDDRDTVLNRQILKGTIVSLNHESVEVRFRYKQRNRHYFVNNRLWAIEHDSLDSSFNSMYRSLYAFLGATPSKKELLLGLRPPVKPSLSAENVLPYPQDIIHRAVEAEEYFLIVGPPGTGKTSIFARRLIEEYHRRPECNILVLAYTNRAVDELCEAIHAALGCNENDCDSYIRVGSELSCAPTYRHRLLQKVAEKAPNRESLRREMEETRIYVATLASILGRMELFTLKHFHLALVDEASQIPEPQLIGLLPRFDKFILIGDHNQLATIVLQQPSHSRIEEMPLREAGINDCRDSLFERLIRRSASQGWDHAAAQLTRQGRMHEEIAAFPARQFYGGNLFTASEWQSEQWQLSPGKNDPLQHLAGTMRTAFLSTEKLNHNSSSDKINEPEAVVIVNLLKSIRDLYLANGKMFQPGRIGIIAPYRNQIALIRHLLLTAGIPGAEEVMIDTVERFQGSQRDLILLSFCVNRPYQMQFLCNLNHDGTVDRKLNVAITRSRQQLFLVGNARIMKQHPVYASLLTHYRKKMIILEPEEINF